MYRKTRVSFRNSCRYLGNYHPIRITPNTTTHGKVITRDGIKDVQPIAKRNSQPVVDSQSDPLYYQNTRKALLLLTTAQKPSLNSLSPPFIVIPPPREKNYQRLIGLHQKVSIDSNG
ncbi:hypothetical protein RCL1_007383 [Eukaryota sp. TZLM3-RCL]